MLEPKDLELITSSIQKIVTPMQEQLNRVEDNVTGIKLHLENVTDKNIQIIAENHVDLSRKLDEALKIENEKELLLIRLNYLEGEIESVKRRISELEKIA